LSVAARLTRASSKRHRRRRESSTFPVFVKDGTLPVFVKDGTLPVFVQQQKESMMRMMRVDLALKKSC